jgi:hypothetical protein
MPHCDIDTNMSQKGVNVNNKRKTIEQDDAEIAFLLQMEREEFEALERRYTEEDLVRSWWFGYESRKHEEEEEEVETGGLWTR